MTANAINHVYMTKIDKIGTFTKAISRNLSLNSHASVSPFEVTRTSDVFIGRFKPNHISRWLQFILCHMYLHNC